MNSVSPPRARRRAPSVRRLGWLASALLVSLSLVGPGTTGAAAAGLAPAGPSLATNGAADQACGLVPLDVEFILDNSGSMSSNSSGGKTRAQWAQLAIQNMIDQLDANGGVGKKTDSPQVGRHWVGLTKYSGTTASVLSSLGANDATASKALVPSVGSGNTPFKTGMAAGASDLAANARSTAFGLTVRHIIIFLSDGRPNPDGPVNGSYATTSSQRPTLADVTAFQAPADEVFSIAIGPSGQGSGSSAVDLGLMQLLAKPSDGTHYANIVNAADLPAAFDSIFQTIACPTAGLGVQKSVTETSFDAPNQVLHYTIVATNTGSATLTNVTVSDPLLGALVCDKAAPVTLAPGGKLTCTGTYTTTQADVDAGKVDNTATADSTETDEVTDSASVPAAQAPALGVEKSVTETSFDEAGKVLHYTIVATNSGNVTLTNVTVSDPLLGALVCTPAQPATLAPGGTISCTGTYTTTQADVDAGKVDNTATASGSFGDKPVGPVDDSRTVPADQEPALGVEKSVEESSFDAPNQVLHYTIVATNSGNVTLTNVTVSDPLLGALVCTPAQPATLAPGGTISCTGTYTTTQADVDAGKVDNTATADSAETDKVSDSASVPAAQVASLVITKGVNGSGEGEFAPNLTTIAGATVHYRIVVSNGGNVTLTGVTLADSRFDLAGLCGPLPTTLAVGESFTCDYTSTAQVGTTPNTATADSEQTDEVDDTASVFVPAPPPTPTTPPTTPPTAPPTPAPTPTGSVEAATPTPTGSVEAVTARPNITPPPTSTGGSTGSPSGDSLRIVLLAVAGLLAILMILTPAAPARSRRR